MIRISNNLIGVLNAITFLLSIPILWAGIWLSRRGLTECERFLDGPLVTLGAFLLAVSLAGILGSYCRRQTWLLSVYLVAMFFLIFALLGFTIFAFVVTHKGAGEVVSGRGYKEYRLGDYSNWLQKRVNKTENWKKIRSCLVDSKVCENLLAEVHPTASVDEFYHQHLSSVQAGCCKPMNHCNYTYVSPTNWTAPAATSRDSDCSLWSNNLNILCFNCPSCKAGLLQNIKHDWKKAAIINIIFLVFLIIVYSVGCCAFKNNREDNYLWKRNPA